MAVVFDASFLIPLLDPRVKGGASNARIDHLFFALSKSREQVIIPTPALSEVLIGANEAAPKYLEIIDRSARFKVAPFGERAAVEAAALHREDIAGGTKKDAGEVWAKVKFDKQIVAIAKVEGATCIYSDDGDIVRHGRRSGLHVVTLRELPDPPKDEPSAQGDMFG